jgi:surface carbohydrate biosynthesis protein
MALTKIAYLLCELRSRDFDANLLVASHLVRDGCAVVFGQRWSIGNNREGAPRGCFFFPTANAIQAGGMAQVAEAGHAVVATDNEAVALSGEWMLSNLSPEALKHDLFLAINERHQAAVTDWFPGTRTRIAGNPRLDLVQRAARALGQGQEHFILFNTNFPLTNSIWGNREQAAQPLRQAEIPDIEARFAFEEARRAALEPVIAWASDQPGENIVIRPHPGEDPAYWRAFAAGRANTRVVVGGSPHAWIRDALLVCHADCTTGLEAALMGKPGLNVSTHAWGARYVMRDVNTTVDSPETAIAVLSEYLKTRRMPPPRRRASDLFPGHGGKKTAKAILDVLRRGGAAAASVASSDTRSTQRLQSRASQPWC